jgi:cell division protein FtsI (penicillin-binding protein 3)
VIGGPQGALTTGGAVSAPIFRTIADKIMTSNLKPNKAINQDSLIQNKSLPTIIASQNTLKELNKKINLKFDLKEDLEYAILKTDSLNNRTITQIAFNKKTIPNVNGMLLDDAIYLLENIGLKVVFSGKGKVVNQSISAGMPINKGSLIQLYLN